MHKKAFTLAEVLITLGIIGVVAALTIPSLIEKHQKSVVETRLKKFYSVMNQALNMSIAEYGEIEFDKDNLTKDNKGQYLDKWMDKYILSHINSIKNSKNDSSFQRKYLLNDGSGFAAYISENFLTIHFFFCINSAQNCSTGSFDGKNSFLFSYYPEKQLISPHGYTINDINTLKYSTNISSYGCYNKFEKGAYGRHYCTRLIELNGWKIPDDYPWLR